MEQRERDISCPYCGKIFTVLIDDSVEEQEYIEDCQVCCRPINFKVKVASDGTITVRITDENE